MGPGLSEGTLVDVRQLRCFLAVACQLSFTRAGERLGMTQPGVSYQVASLERTLGVKLFLRGAMEVQLTVAGVFFFRRIQRLCVEYEEFTASCRGDQAEGTPETTQVTLDIRQLRCFLAVVHHQNFTKAGADIFRTQSGISYQIASLEKSLGLKLFHRSARSISLTEVGASFCAAIRALVVDFEGIVLHAQGLAAGDGGSLTIGFLGGVEMRLLPQLLRGFSADFPGTRVQTAHVTLAHMFDAIMAGEIDCGFTMLFDHGHPAAIQTQVVLRDRMMAVMAADHPLASQEKLKLTNLKGQPLLSLSQDIAGPGVAWHRAQCAKHGLDYDSAEFVPDFPSLILGIEMGRGIAIQPRQVIEEHSNTRLRFVELEDEDMVIEFALAWKVEGTNPYVPLFLQALNRT